MFSDTNIWKFRTNIPALFELLGSAEEKEGNFGTQYRYKIRVDGKQGWWYATFTAYNFLEAHGIGEGDSVELTLEEGEGNKKRWRATFEGETFYSDNPRPRPSGGSSGPSAGNSGHLTAGKPAPTKAPQTAPKAPREASIASLGAVLRSCLLTAQAIYSRDVGFEYTHEDVRTSAHCLFVEANKKGIQPKPEQVKALIKLCQKMDFSGESA